MKSYIVTFYNNGNLGSELQATAMMHLLKEKGLEPVFIKKGHKSKAVKGFALITRKLQLICAPKDIKSILKIKDDYTSKHERESQSTIEMIKRFSRSTKNTILCTERSLSKLNDGIFVCGSDQIWSPLIYPLNKVNYLCGINPSLKIAYSVSFGVNKLPDSFIKKITPYLKSFRYLSLREKSASLQVSEIIERSTTTTCDPVFLMSETWWKHWQKKPKNLETNLSFIFCYFLDKPKDDVYQFIRQISKDKTIVYICYQEFFRNFDNSIFLDVGPEEFLYLVDHSYAIITDSFHAVSFSVIFKKQFYAFSRNHPAELTQDGRIADLLQDLSINERLNSYTENSEPINYNVVDNLLSEKANQSKAYLTESIDEICEEYKNVFGN